MTPDEYLQLLLNNSYSRLIVERFLTTMEGLQKEMEATAKNLERIQEEMKEVEARSLRKMSEDKDAVNFLIAQMSNNFFQLDTPEYASSHVVKAEFSPGGRFIFTMGPKRTHSTTLIVHIRDLSTSPPSAIHVCSDAVDATFLSDGSLLTSHHGRDVTLWELNSEGGRLTLTPSRVRTIESCKCVSSSNSPILRIDTFKRLSIIGCADGSKSVIRNTSPLAKDISSFEDIQLIEFSADGQVMAQATSTRISVSTEAGQSVEYLIMDDQNTGSSNKEHWVPQAMCISPDGSYLVVVWHHRVRYWRITKGEGSWKAFSPHSGDRYVHAAVSADNEHMVLLEGSGRISVFRFSEDDDRAETQQTFHGLDLSQSELKSQVSFIALHPTGQFAVVATAGARVCEIGTTLRPEGDPMDTRSDGVKTPEATEN